MVYIRVYRISMHCKYIGLFILVFHVVGSTTTPDRTWVIYKYDQICIYCIYVYVLVLDNIKNRTAVANPMPPTK